MVQLMLLGLDRSASYGIQDGMTLSFYLYWRTLKRAHCCNVEATNKKKFAILVIAHDFVSYAIETVEIWSRAGVGFMGEVDLRITT